MKKFLEANYEKIAVGMSLLVLGIFALLSLLGDDRREPESFRGENGATLAKKERPQKESEETPGVIILETKTPHGLMPEELVIIGGAEPEFFNGNFTVETILFPKKDTKVTLLLSDGNIISGILKQSGENHWN